MQYYEVKIRDTKSLIPREDGSTFWPEKHGRIIRVDVFAFSKKQLNPKSEKLSPQQLGYNAQNLIRISFGITSSTENILGEVYVDLRSIKKIDKAKYLKRKSQLVKDEKVSTNHTEAKTEKKVNASKPNNVNTSPEKRWMFVTVAASLAFFGLQFAVSPIVSAILLIFGLLFGPVIVGLIFSAALEKKGELNNKVAGFIAAAIFALISIFLLKSDLIDEARNTGSNRSYKECIDGHRAVFKSTEPEAALHCKSAGY